MQKVILNAKAVSLAMLITFIVNLTCYGSEENYEEIESLVKSSVKFEVYGSVDQFADGFVDGLREIGDLPFNMSQIQDNLEFYLIRCLHERKGICTYDGGKHSAYQLGFILNARKRVGGEVLDKDSAEDIISRLDMIQNEVLKIMDSVDIQEGKDAIIHEIKVLLGRDKRALSDPTFITAPVNLGTNHVLNFLSDFRAGLHELLDTNIEIDYLNAKYVGLALSPPIIDALKYRERVQRVPMLFRIIYKSHVQQLHGEPGTFTGSDSFRELRGQLDSLDRKVGIEASEFRQMMEENKSVRETIEREFVSMFLNH